VPVTCPIGRPDAGIHGHSGTPALTMTRIGTALAARSGYIQRLPSGAFRLSVYAGTDPLTGRQIRLRRTCKTERSAQIELGRLLEQAAAAVKLNIKGLRHQADPVSEVSRRAAAYLAQVTAGSAIKSD
jgi:hypothetical protein